MVGRRDTQHGREEGYLPWYPGYVPPWYTRVYTPLYTPGYTTVIPTMSVPGMCTVSSVSSSGALGSREGITVGREP